MSVSAIICHPDARETRTHVAEMADPWGIKEADFEVRKEEQELLRIEELKRCLASHEDRGADLERRLAVHDELRTHARGGAAAPRVGEEQRRAAQETEEERRQLLQRLEELQLAAVERGVSALPKDYSWPERLFNSSLSDIPEHSPDAGDAGNAGDAGDAGRAARTVAALRVKDLQKELALLAAEVSREADATITFDQLQSKEAQVFEAQAQRAALATLWCHFSEKAREKFQPGAFTVQAVEAEKDTSREQAEQLDSAASELRATLAQQLENVETLEGAVQEEEHLELQQLHELRALKAESATEQKVRLRRALVVLKKEHEVLEGEKARVYHDEIATLRLELEQIEECYRGLECHREEELRSERLAEHFQLGQRLLSTAASRASEEDVELPSSSCVQKGDAAEQRTRYCDLEGLPDLCTSCPNVQRAVGQYLTTLLQSGVAGFRIDAAKHQDAGELKALLQQTGSLPWVFQEVIEGGGEAVTAQMYQGIGKVTEFNYARQLAPNFLQEGKLKYLGSFGESWGLISSDTAVVFMDNHDTQRGEAQLTYKNGGLYSLANVFMLAHPYGYPKVMSSYVFDAHDQGPPSQPVHSATGVACGGQPWVCEHRYPEIANMVAWRRSAGANKTLESFTASDDGNGAFFCRSSSACVALNRGSGTWTTTVKTSMPAGQYKNVIQSSGSNVEVKADGTANLVVPSLGAVAFHVNAAVEQRPTIAII
ncbi:4-alpha-D-glucan glucanohydrolase) [Durusdinium trenchii]|uniref:alpha-amylase n=1 Tax=Durusdinium trenchii TaxID=1381693 RepID=A0ABP0KVT7_9DINO